MASVGDARSNMEGIPVSLMEAMCVSLPVISTTRLLSIKLIDKNAFPLTQNDLTVTLSTSFKYKDIRRLAREPARYPDPEKCSGAER